MKQQRKLVTVRRIENVFPIEGADAIECVQIEGWRVVVKKGEFKKYDLAVYFEIDSWLPATDERFTFLCKYKKQYNGVEGARLRTVKLRGQISQGLALPIASFPEVEAVINIGIGQLFGEEVNVIHEASQNRAMYAWIRELDFTHILGVRKWEPPIDPRLGGVSKGGFPHSIPKTDQERVQNLPKLFTDEKYSNLSFEVTVKLDGSSMTCYLDEGGEFNVCSRNLNLKESETNAFWVVARKMQLEEKLKVHLEKDVNRYALQGELIGPGIQGNPEQLQEHQFYCYDVWDIDGQRYLTPIERWEFLQQLDVPQVPILEEVRFNKFSNVQDILEYAEGPSLNPKVKREGVVFKCMQFDFSFKAIANSYLLKHKDR